MIEEIELGFETIGNATAIVHDRGPRLVTDPWLTGCPYFGSWTLSHEIPEKQWADALACPYVWISHGHPDHLSAESLEFVRGRTVLLPDHVGGRIASALRRDGHHVRVLPDRRWVDLSPRVRVCCVADYNQDGILLIDVGGALVVNLNDASDHGWRSFVRREVARHPVSFHLHIAPWGEADMCNLFDEDGTRIPRYADPRPVGQSAAAEAEAVGARFVVPFSSMHQYQRSDSVWANDRTVDVEDWSDGFVSDRTELLPAFVQYDALRDHAAALEPAVRPRDVLEPSMFGDDWCDTLEHDDVAELERYVRAIRHLWDHFDFVSFRVGGVEHRVGLDGGSTAPGFTFEVPRTSLLTAVRHDVFDDLLIGNFMRTVLHNTTDPGALYPHFTPYVGKYADNGGARTTEELRAYFAAYRRRAPFDFLRHRLEARSIDAFRRFVPPGSPARRLARRVHHRMLTGRQSGR